MAENLLKVAQAWSKSHKWFLFHACAGSYTRVPRGEKKGKEAGKRKKERRKEREEKRKKGTKAQ